MSQVEKLLQAALALPPDDLRYFIKILVQVESAKPAMTEEQFQAHLAKEGIIGASSESLEDRATLEDFKPIKIQGKPLSQTIVEERK
jgi:hypothetical protein